jgi:hypothetical protein
MNEERAKGDAERDGHKRPPGDFTSEELEKDTARFLDELRRRAEKQRQSSRRRRVPPPPP